ncbi:Maf family protein [Dongia deserti]|uniref:Maf family protein n=1 Tax=Dongia deserti TaxID=2268030 RepID=UPI000E6531B4|nr:Maf family protein [Dongia deserti]
MPVAETGRQQLVLASGSARRRDLLRQIGLEPSIIDPPHIDEHHGPRELPLAYARRMAHEKLAVIAPQHRGSWVLAADTVVACGRRILPKAETEAQARACLDLLSGRRHSVLGGIAVAAPDGRIAERVVTTTVAFKRLTAREIDAYIATGDWHGKAGGYAIQGHAAAFIPWINGSYGNVVGLSISDAVAMLGGLGWRV